MNGGTKMLRAACVRLQRSAAAAAPVAASAHASLPSAHAVAAPTAALARHTCASARRYTRPATRTTVSDLLAVSKQFRSKQTHFIMQDQTLRDAVLSLAKNENSATLVVVNDAHQVVGLLTNHIVLEKLAKINGGADDDAWRTKVRHPRACVCGSLRTHRTHSTYKTHKLPLTLWL